jgi:hypothetical protein
MSDPNKPTDTTNTVETVNFTEDLKIHNLLLNFFKNHQMDLIKLYKKNLEEIGTGVMLLTLNNEKSNVNVKYIPLSVIPEPMFSDINEKYTKNNYDLNIIYFIIASPEAENIIEMDISSVIFDE